MQTLGYWCLYLFYIHLLEQVKRYFSTYLYSIVVTSFVMIEE